LFDNSVFKKILKINLDQILYFVPFCLTSNFLSKKKNNNNNDTHFMNINIKKTYYLVWEWWVKLGSRVKQGIGVIGHTEINW